MFKKSMTKAVTVLLLVVMIVSALVVVPSSAATTYVTYRKGDNNVSSYYKASKYYKQLTSVPLTGDNPTDVVAVGLSQLGYIEGSSQKGFDGTTGGGNNYTEFCWNLGCGSAYYWCAAFVSFCLFQGRATDHDRSSDMSRSHTNDYKTYFWKEISCTTWTKALRTAGYFKWSKAFASSQGQAVYTPKPGDLIFYTWSRNTSNGSDHIGVVAYVDGGYVYTVEGNTSSGSGLDDNGDGCFFKKYPIGSTNIYGYGAMPYKRDSSVAVDFSGKNPTPGTYVNAHYKGRYLYESESLTGNSSIIPKYAQIKVLEVIKKYTGSDDLSLLKVEYNGKVGYIKDVKSMRLVQISSTGSSNAATETSKPINPAINAFTGNSVTLIPMDGYEYMVEGGQWQKSNVFENLDANTQYKFYQRFENGTEQSEALTVKISDLLAADSAGQLSSLTIEGATLEFDPNTRRYNVRLPDTLTEIPEVTATAASDTSNVRIVKTEFDEDGKGTVRVVVTPAQGTPVTYLLVVSLLPAAEFMTPEELEALKPTTPDVDDTEGLGDDTLGKIIIIAVAAFAGMAVVTGVIVTIVVLKNKRRRL